ncbi:MAG: glycosyl transferase [Verrucomicrobia bacterium]|nr:MAG: glycosyl transferase [Verrucomicrobiota bacterium]
MKIAQVAPLYESVPPKLYGGTERVVSYITEALVAMGHEVVLYASGDSRTGARLRACSEKALRLDNGSVDPIADHFYMAEQVFREAIEFDVIHSHMDYLAFPLLRRLRTPHVTTLHGRLDIPNLRNLYREYCDIPVVSISNDQRRPLWWASWQATVYHGVPEDLYTFHSEPGEYLAFLGRISPEKRVDRAIRMARCADIPIKIAAKVDKVDQQYFDAEIKPLLKQPGVEYIGEIGEAEKNEFLGNALALLFPIDWPEPFGLVMIEAMACGTPVIACARGSVPEIVEDGVTGFLVNSVKDGHQALGKVAQLSRKRCREVFEERFSVRRMAQDYLAVYGRLVEQSKVQSPKSKVQRSKFNTQRSTFNAQGSTSKLLIPKPKTQSLNLDAKRSSNGKPAAKKRATRDRAMIRKRVVANFVGNSERDKVLDKVPSTLDFRSSHERCD